MSRIENADNFIASLGHEAYRVGGSVRDEIIGRAPKDADYIVRGVALDDLARAILANGGKPSLIKDRKNQPLGWRTPVKGFGLVEIVLPRTERSTGDGRDMEITLDKDLPLEEDAKRRDFTFNALYKRVDGGTRILRFLADGRPIDVLDPTEHGVDDLMRRVVRVTHYESFRDDPLRTLRALRFVSTLDADLDYNTVVLMTRDADAVTGISLKGHTSGTVLDEIKKLLMGQSPAKALRIARDTGVLANILPELEPMLSFKQESRYHDFTVDEHTFKALDTAAKVDAPLRVRMALLFHDSGKPASAWRGADGRLHYYRNPDDPTQDAHEVISERIWLEAADRLNVERRLKYDVATLIREHMVNLEGKLKPSKVRRERVRLGDDMLRDLYLHRACDLSGKGSPDKGHIERIMRLESVRRQAQGDNVPSGPGDLAVDGNDLKALGIEGREIGRVQKLLLDEVVVDPQPRYMVREWQMERAAALASS